MSVAGKAVVITGGRRGIGQVCADRLVAEGARVVVTSRSWRWDESAAAPGDGERVEMGLDVTKLDEVERLFVWIKERLGTIDVLVNNAGVGHFKPLVATTIEEWRAMIDTNLTGPFLCTRAAWELLAEGGGGRIVNIGSIAGEIPIGDNGAYAASKYGLRGLTAVTGVEGEALGVRASLLSLGAVHTDIWDGREGFDASDMLPPEAVADALLYLAGAEPAARIEELKLWPPKGVL